MRTLPCTCCGAVRNLGDHDNARPLVEEGIARAHRGGDKERLASLYCNLGLLETDIGASIEAIEVLERALALDRELGDSWAEACDRVNLAVARLGARQAQEATSELQAIAPDVLALNDDDLKSARSRSWPWCEPSHQEQEQGRRLVPPGYSDALGSKH